MNINKYPIKRIIKSFKDLDWNKITDNKLKQNSLIERINLRLNNLNIDRLEEIIFFIDYNIKIDKIKYYKNKYS